MFLRQLEIDLTNLDTATTCVMIWELAHENEPLWTAVGGKPILAIMLNCHFEVIFAGSVAVSPLLTLACFRPLVDVLFVHMHIQLYMIVCVYTYVYICMCVCMQYIYIFTSLLIYLIIHLASHLASLCTHLYICEC